MNKYHKINLKIEFEDSSEPNDLILTEFRVYIYFLSSLGGQIIWERGEAALLDMSMG